MTGRNTLFKKISWYGGFSGLFGGLIYLLYYFFPFSNFTSLILIFLFCTFSIISCYTIKEILNLQYKYSHWSFLGFINGTISMVIVAIIVCADITLKNQASINIDQEFNKTINVFQTLFFSLNLMCDFFTTLSLLFYCIAFLYTSFIKPFWCYAGIALSLTVFAMNIISQWPPVNRESIEMGPSLGIFEILISIRLLNFHKKDDFSLIKTSSINYLLNKK